ncbi:MAG: hypothetical protein E5W70_20225 [Mesorhizobium sp.]|nr:MAG: hypothetical protein E5W70_20225 [Mesorhizobium sp.]
MEDELLDYCHSLCDRSDLPRHCPAFRLELHRRFDLGMLDRCRASRCDQVDPRKSRSTLTRKHLWREEARFSAGFFTPMMADHLTQKAPPSP